MKKWISAILVAVLLMTGCICESAFAAAAQETTAAQSEKSGITVYKNGSIYTSNANHEYVTAMAVQDGRFIYVGDDAGAAELEAQADLVVDLQGKTVIPG